jgi:hypothetical protein
MTAWLTPEIDKIEDMRDRGLSWSTISAEFPKRTQAQVCSAYHNRKRKRERDTNRERQRTIERAGKVQQLAAPAPARAPAPPLPIMVDRRMPWLEPMRDWAELCQRIAERGLTGGYLGDPPPGRSALDERTRAAAAGREPSISVGGSDGR